MIGYIAKFFKALNVNAHPGDIAHAVALGFLLAILPKENLTFIFLFFLSLFIRTNKGAFFISFILLGFITPMMDILINRIGLWTVQLEILRPVFLYLENIPFVGWFKLSNTMVFGGLLFGVVLYLPVYILFRLLVFAYRRDLHPTLRKIWGAGVVEKIPFLKKISDIYNFEVEQ